MYLRLCKYECFLPQSATMSCLLILDGRRNQTRTRDVYWHFSLHSPGKKESHLSPSRVHSSFPSHVPCLSVSLSLSFGVVVFVVFPPPPCMCKRGVQKLMSGVFLAYKLNHDLSLKPRTHLFGNLSYLSCSWDPISAPNVPPELLSNSCSLGFSNSHELILVLHPIGSGLNQLGTSHSL